MKRTALRRSVEPRPGGSGSAPCEVAELKPAAILKSDKSAAMPAQSFALGPVTTFWSRAEPRRANVRRRSPGAPQFLRSFPQHPLTSQPTGRQRPLCISRRSFDRRHSRRQKPASVPPSFNGGSSPPCPPAPLPPPKSGRHNRRAFARREPPAFRQASAGV